MLTDHQSYTFKALQSKTGVPIEIVSGVRELPDRREQGWSLPNVDGLHVSYLPHTGWWRDGMSILRRNEKAIHLFNGLWGDRRLFLFLLEAQRRGICAGLVTESYSEKALGYYKDETGFSIRMKAFIRPFLYRLAGVLVARKLQVVFAISEKAVNQFEHIGVSRQVICPFGYFVPQAAATGISMPSVADEGAKLRIVFVGALIERKGLRILIDVMESCHQRQMDVHLDVYGPGDSCVFDDVDLVSYRGVIPFGASQSVIANYDLLFLPSMYDGWGVVVNEALMQGVPALLSDQVGAKTLIEKSGAGHIFRIGCNESVVNVLQELIDNPGKLSAWKQAAKSFRSELSPEKAAEYMYKSLQHYTGQGKGAGVSAPWYR